MLGSERTLESLHQHLSPVDNQAPSDSPEPSEQLVAVNTNAAVILAALFCALICVLGLALVACFAWLRRTSSYTSSSYSGDVLPPYPEKGIKKKVLRSLSRITFRLDSADAAKLVDCPICLAEFIEGDEIRVLPQCGHGFHVDCIDRWLGSHSSCPSCRQILPLSPSGAASLRVDEENSAKAREDGDANRFLH